MAGEETGEDDEEIGDEDMGSMIWMASQVGIRMASYVGRVMCHIGRGVTPNLGERWRPKLGEGWRPILGERLIIFYKLVLGYCGRRNSGLFENKKEERRKGTKN